MAKRRKIAAPSAAELNAVEEEFRRETLSRPNPGMAPIAQVSADSAQAQPVGDPQMRIQMAQDTADAKVLRMAEAEGRLILALPIDSIQPDVIVRDRTVIDPTEMAELKASIAAHGLRLPIEVFARREGRRSYGLLSGFRRLRAVRELYEETGEDRYKTIAGLVREPDTLGGGFVAMVEENEVRAALSHYERGRISVVAAQRGAFPDTESAVDALFHAASKAKRSKIRSFALIFEELGDLLSHAEGLKERDGLRLATALRAGAQQALRDALSEAQADTAEQEWAALEPVIAAAEKKAKPVSGGRPRKATKTQVLRDVSLPGGVGFRGETDGKAYVIRFRGKGVDQDLIERAMAQLEAALGDGND